MSDNRGALRRTLTNVDEFVESLPDFARSACTSARNAVFSASAAASRCVNATTSAASSSYDGGYTVDTGP